LPNNSVKSTLTPALSQRRGGTCAFTLAEVLITLVIIGVIAAITVPTFINKTQNQEYVSKLKKAYSTLAQATNLIIAEEGSPKNNWADSIDHVYELYIKHLNNAKECSEQAGCFKQSKYKRLDNSMTMDYNSRSDYRKFILSDGSQVGIYEVSNTCSWNNSDNDGSNNVCARFHVDINGEKKPNAIGRDFFEFVLKENGLYPAGCDDITQCNNTTRGFACTCKVLREQAINY